MEPENIGRMNELFPLCYRIATMSSLSSEQIFNISLGTAGVASLLDYATDPETRGCSGRLVNTIRLIAIIFFAAFLIQTVYPHLSNSGSSFAPSV